MPESDLAEIYREFLAVLARGGDSVELSRVVDPDAYREECVGFTPGWVDFQGALESFHQATAGLGPLGIHVDDLYVADDRVFARLTVSAGNSGPDGQTAPPVTLRGADHVRIFQGRIVERWWLLGNTSRGL